MLFLFTRTLLIYVVIAFSVRFMGKRQLGELEPSELITTVMLSNLASICIEEPTLPIFYSLIPVCLLTVLELLNSVLAFRIPAYERFLSGKPITVVRDGKIDQDHLREMRLSIRDLLKALRGQGIFSPSDAALAIVETDGSISALPQQEKPFYLPVLIDGCVIEDNLQYLGLNRSWLTEQLSAHGYKMDSPLLLVLSNGTELQIIPIETGRKG